MNENNRGLSRTGPEAELTRFSPDFQVPMIMPIIRLPLYDTFEENYLLFASAANKAFEPCVNLKHHFFNILAFHLDLKAFLVSFKAQAEAFVEVAVGKYNSPEGKLLAGDAAIMLGIEVGLENKIASNDQYCKLLSGINSAAYSTLRYMADMLTPKDPHSPAHASQPERDLPAVGVTPSSGKPPAPSPKGTKDPAELGAKAKEMAESLKSIYEGKLAELKNTQPLNDLMNIIDDLNLAASTEAQSLRVESANGGLSDALSQKLSMLEADHQELLKLRGGIQAALFHAAGEQKQFQDNIDLVAKWIA